MNSETLSFSEKIHYYHRFLRYSRRSEPDTVQFIKEEFEPGGTALDIGANKGIVTYFLGKRAGSEGRVIAFEPQPEMKQQITKVTHAFGLDNVEIHSLGLSDNCGTATLYRGKSGATANLVKGSEWQKEKIEVETKTLDSFILEDGMSRLDFIKCDVDGFESQVLRGAKETLRKFTPKVMVEISEKLVPEVAGILADLGYDDGVFLYKGKRYPTSQTKEIDYRHASAKWRNFLFCRK